MPLQLRSVDDGAGSSPFQTVRDPRDLVFIFDPSDATSAILEIDATPDGSSTPIEIDGSHVTSEIAKHLGDFPLEIDLRCTVNGGSADVYIDGKGIS